MCNNARIYNQEGSWVYVDAEEMEKVFDAAYDRVMSGSGLPGAPGGMAGRSDSALTPMEEDLVPQPSKMKTGGGRKMIISDDEYLTPSEDD
jgi:ATP-dependent helicase STH1/SNF2